MRFLPVLFGVFLFILCGCDENAYEVVLRPDGKGLVRELTCWRWDPDAQGKPLRPFPQAELNRIAKAYEQDPPTSAARKFTFAVVVERWMPDDIGGAGWYAHFPTAMGTFFSYSERFRGSDDFAGRLERQLGAVDRLVEILAGWLDTRLNGTDGWPELRVFVEGDFRRDLRNLVLYWMSCQMSLPDTVSPDGDGTLAEKAFELTLFRLLHAVVERGYITPDQLPAHAQLWEETSCLGPEERERRIGRQIGVVLETKVGLRDTEAKRALQSLLGTDAPFVSLREYLETLPEWAPHVDGWEEGRLANPQLAPPDSMAIIEELFKEMLFPQDGNGAARVAVRLICPCEPIETNGEWRKDDSCVAWSTRIQTPERLPTFCYAFWAVPDASFQAKHFGRTVLQGALLMEYVFCESLLTGADARAWRMFLEGVAPGNGLARKIGAFRFSGVVAAEEGAESQMETAVPVICELLVAAIERGGKGEATAP